MTFIHLNDEQVQLYLDGHAADSLQIEHHIQICSKCRNLVQRYRELYTALKKDETPQIFTDSLVADILNQAYKLQRKESTIWETLLIITSLVISVVTSLYFLNPAPLFAKMTQSVFSFFTRIMESWSPQLLRTLPILLIALVILILYDLADRKFIRPKLTSSAFKGK